MGQEDKGLSWADTKVIIGAFLVVLVGITAATYSTLFLVPPHAPSTVVTVSTTWELVAANIKYNSTNPTIYVPVGQKVTLTIVNNDGMAHTFDIDELNIHTGTINPGESKTVTFTMTSASSYKYYCSIHPGLMDGQVTALASSGS
ncbi:MAG TPA: cupredoxin domain-containing protein [Conexivisphaerales archaeon]|nr:cupredoxin domain-containing protein [Conexivisphaerales archaeon]